MLAVYRRLRGIEKGFVMRWILLTVLMGSMLLAGASLAYAEGATEPMGKATTNWPVQTQGSTETHTDMGAIRIQPDVMAGVRLQAEQVTVEFEWERGYEAGGRDPAGRVVTERDRETQTFQEADIRFDRFMGNGLFLAFSDDATARMTLESQRGLTFTGIQDHAVVKIGPRPEAVRAGESAGPGFWYRVEEPALHATGPGQVHVTGSFTLFVHDVVVHIDAAEDEWSRWTGYQQNQTGPLAGFEFRLTRIHVENGTLITFSEEDVDLYAPIMEADLKGSVSVPGAIGRLLQDQRLLIFDEDRMVLEGSGTLGLQASGANETGPVAVWLYPSGDFRAHGATTLQAVRAGPNGPTAPVVLVGLAGFALVTLTTAGLARAGVIPTPTEVSRRKRYAMWMSRGRLLYAEGQVDHASNCFRKAAKTKREEPLAWYHWARTTLETGHLESAEQIAQQAAQVPGIDPLDVLDLRASAAWQRGDQETFGRLLTELARQSPEMAQRFVFDFEIQASSLTPELRRAINSTGSEAVLDGYA